MAEEDLMAIQIRNISNGKRLPLKLIWTSPLWYLWMLSISFFKWLSDSEFSWIGCLLGHLIAGFIIFPLAAACIIKSGYFEGKSYD
jgi:hypothetical protein